MEDHRLLNLFEIKELQDENKRLAKENLKLLTLLTLIATREDGIDRAKDWWEDYTSPHIESDYEKE